MGNANNKPFYIKDCSLTTIALGLKAQTLVELRDKIAVVSEASLYVHIWGGRLRPSFQFTEYHNDFAVWAHTALHDDVLAERLDIINPIDYSSLEKLRSDLLNQIEARLEEREIVPLAAREDQFNFARSKIIVFDTNVVLNNPKDLAKVLPHLTESSFFYHVIDASRRLPSRMNDFSIWLQGFNGEHDELIARLQKVDPYFISLSDVKQNFVTIITNYFSNG